MEVCILQFAKTPEAGRVKTRLTPPLTAAQANELHQKLVLHVAEEVSQLPRVRHEIWSTAGGAFIEETCERFGANHKLQQGEDLGERLSFAAQSTLEHFGGVILIGSDCPFVTISHVNKAIAFLSETANDLVIGPADDGGYVLLGLKLYRPGLFEDIHWGTDQVFTQTKASAESLALTLVTLESLRDIDRPEDLEFLAQQDGFQYLSPV